MSAFGPRRRITVSAEIVVDYVPNTPEAEAIPLDDAVRDVREAVLAHLRDEYEDDDPETTISVSATASGELTAVLLMRFSEWLDSEGLIVGDSGPGADKRSHEELATEFAAKEASR